MKNNKTTQLILGLALIGIWGMVGYRIYISMQGNDLPPLPSRSFIAIDTSTDQTATFFGLALDYRDPFLDKSTLPSPAPSPSNDLNTPPPPVPQLSVNKNVTFPNIQYKGYSQNKATGKKIVLLQLNNKSYKATLGQNLEEVTIIGIYADSLVVTKKGRIKSFFKN